MTEGSPAVEFAAAVLERFLHLGVRHIVVCPGSRSQALALAAAEFERSGAVTLHVRVDERSAAFLALGLAVETAQPVIVVTTSGTAVANLHPAVLEAHHSGVPLILLTADRPEELRGIGSNQTTDQFGMFGSAVRFAREVEAPSSTGFDRAYIAELAAEAYSAAAGHSGAPGPVQLNMSFREPLSGPFSLPSQFSTEEVAPANGPLAGEPPSGARSAMAERISAQPETVVIAGHGAGARASDIAVQLGAPLIAEVSSGAHFGPNLVVAYRELLRDVQFGGRVRRAIVFGHPTLSREVPELLSRDEVETVVVRCGGGEDYNPGRQIDTFVDDVEVADGPDNSREARAWLGTWVAASRTLSATDPIPTADPRTDDRVLAAEFARSQLAAFREPISRRMLVNAVWQKTWPHDRLVFAASRLIREADASVPGKKIRVHANRGLAGIDGTIATATGIAIASQSAEHGGNAAAGTTRVVLGDLALLHDVGSLLGGAGEDAPRMQLIVGNDGGGTLFDLLEVAETANPAAFDRVLYTPHQVHLSGLAEAYGWDYRFATNRGELDEALSSASGRTIIEVPLAR